MPNKKRIIAGIVLLVCLFAAGYMLGSAHRKQAARQAASQSAAASSAVVSSAA